VTKSPIDHVQVLLCGGPAEHLPQEERICSVPDDESVIKLPRGAHYDHYAPTAERIRRWTRTAHLRLVPSHVRRRVIPQTPPLPHKPPALRDPFLPGRARPAVSLALTG